MSTVTIKSENGNLAVKSPYNNDFVSAARQLGGKWNKPVANAWNFNEKDEVRVRELCMNVYGTDGSPMPTGTIRIVLDKVSPSAYTKYDELVIGPIQVLKKFDRDSTPKLGAGCVVVAGKLQSFGGSRNNPRITYDAGTVIEVRDVPQTIINQLVADDPDAYQVVESDSNSNDLTAEEKSLVIALQTLPADRLEMILAQLD